MTNRTTIRARLTLTSAVLLVGAVTAACGGGSGAPSDASEDGFCEAANSLLTDLMPDDMTTPEVPSDEDMARAVKDWGTRMEEVGTPEDISDDARAGFEAVLDQIEEIDASDFSAEKLEELGDGGAEASEEVQRQAEAFGDYVTDTCGNPMDDIEVPELEMPETTQ
ncbi:hypothetical protein [Nocardioides ganghwensis]|jgi:hypothetical protein|uniref:Small secreted protein n=1 Tax=Nocardioides ganghwensis TaxID=252230 RepID=A0A4Q2SD49_9ACTN|nr:hypothetical protein [Nocardioides ganghwensis]MBD3947299.1 hypothetical protein [Nocardioides ganghwensis]RYC00248.1 hypothetical protein EUA07_13990 [Nocardioides ganghwensis]